MSAHDDEPVVIRMPFAVACELEGYLAVLTDIHADTLLRGRDDRLRQPHDTRPRCRP